MFLAILMQKYKIICDNLCNLWLFLYICAKNQTSMQELELKTIIQVCQPEELTPEEQHLLQQAIEATDRSYAPYSNFRVGAAVRLDNGIEITGSNQ